MASITEERRIVPPPREPEHVEAAHGVSHGMWGVVIFIASEVMFFAALFTTYFYLRAQHPEWTPPSGERPGAWPFRGQTGEFLPTINTLVLLSSSFVIQWASGRLERGERKTFVRGLVAALALGVLFLIGQFGLEYPRLFRENLVPQSGLFGAVFFTLTGFHGLHVTGGVLFFIVVLWRALHGQFSARRRLAVEAASIYWHFVDVVWIGLYSTIYLL